MHGALFYSGSGKRARTRTCSYSRKMIGSGPDTFSWRTDFPPSPGHIILEADSISCLVGQNFLGKCVPPDISAWRTHFPPTPACILP